MKLNLGSGKRPKEGYINIDIHSFPEVDIVADITKGLPMEDSSVDYVYSEDWLEHLPPESKIPVMNEIWRVLKPGGIFLSHTPIYPYASAFRDPTHINILTVETFPLYFDDQTRWGSIYGFTGAFKILHQTIKRPHLISVLEKV